MADVRSYAVASLTSGGMPIGGLHMYRHEVRPFSDAEQNRLASFAAQASLAIANAKLFNDLDQALERQRAMTDVLEAVSTARFDIQPVFDRIVEHAAHLCDDTAALVTIRDRAELSVMAGAGWGELGNQDVLHWDAIDTSTTTGTVFSTGEPVHIPDWDEVPPDRYPNSKARDSGLRTMLTLPMRRHHVVIGAMTFAREHPAGTTPRSSRSSRRSPTRRRSPSTTPGSCRRSNSATPSSANPSSCRQPRARSCSSSAPIRVI